METSLSSLSAILAGLIIIYYIIYRKKYFEKHRIPHPKAYPLLGNMIPVMLGKLSFIENMTNAYNYNKDAKYVGFYDFSGPVTIIRDLDLIKSITTKHFDHFVDHQSFIANPELEPLFGNNLFVLRGDRWREIRALITGAFTSSKMKAMFKLMSDCGSTFAEYLVDQSREGMNEINSKDSFTRYANDTIATCAFGISVDSMANPTNDFYTLGREATNFEGLKSLRFLMVQNFPMISKLFGIKLIDANIEKFFCNLVRNTMAVRDKEGIYRPDMIQLMMETRNREPGSKKPELTIESMTSQLFIFFLGGFETTSTLMCFAAHEIASHPEIQKKLQEEIDRVLEECEGEPTYEAVNSMQYLDAIVNESLRLYPVPGFMDRVCTKNFELPPSLPGLKPLLIKSGDRFWIPVWGIQRDPQYFPDPDQFIPERFIEDKNAINTSAYLPFGVGPRMCIGNRFALLETKVLLFHLLAKCNIKPAEKMILPMRLSKKDFAMMAEGGFWLEIHPRK